MFLFKGYNLDLGGKRPLSPLNSANKASITGSSMPTEVIKNAKLIWDYLASFHQGQTSDAIVVCCSYDLRVCDYACGLMAEIGAQQLLFSGNTGNWTRQLWDEPEAKVFKARAIKNGIDPALILTEEQATNIGENIAFSKKLLPDAETITFVTKPNTILRVKLTVPLHWSGITAVTACPPFTFPDRVSNIVGMFGVINEMVGDIQRILSYPALGYQIAHNLPAHILTAYEFLIDQGFTEHLMRK